MTSGQKIQRTRNQNSKLKKCCWVFLGAFIVFSSLFSLFISLQMITNYQRLNFEIEKTMNISNENNLNDTIAKILVEEISTLKIQVEQMKKGFLKLSELFNETSKNSTNSSWSIGEMAEAGKEKMVSLKEKLEKKAKLINEKYKIKEKAGALKQNVVEGGKRILQKSKNLTKSLINKFSSLFNSEL